MLYIQTGTTHHRISSGSFGQTGDFDATVAVLIDKHQFPAELKCITQKKKKNPKDSVDTYTGDVTERQGSSE